MKSKLFIAILAMSFALTSCGSAEKADTTADLSVSGAETMSTEEETKSQEDEEVISESSTGDEEEIIKEEETVEEKEVSRIWDNQADISWIDPEKPMVAFSFDDGPVSNTSESSSAMRIQNALAENGMHATFFYWGNSLNGLTKKEIQRAYELGFEIGNHTAKHPNLTELSAEEISAQVAEIDEVLKEITGQEQFLVRPPYLAVNQLVKDTINVPLISCGMDSSDWAGATAQEMIDKFVAAAEDGSLDGMIVLMHETYYETAEAIEYLVPYLKDKGYQIVTISEMYKVRNHEMSAGKVYGYCAKQ